LSRQLWKAKGGGNPIQLVPTCPKYGKLKIFSKFIAASSKPSEKSRSYCQSSKWQWNWPGKFQEHWCSLN